MGDGKWNPRVELTSIGNRRLVRMDPVTAEKIRLRVTKAAVCPAISEFGVYAEPSPAR